MMVQDKEKKQVDKRRLKPQKDQFQRQLRMIVSMWILCSGELHILMLCTATTTKDLPESTLQPIFEEEVLDEVRLMGKMYSRDRIDIMMCWILNKIALMFLPKDQVTRGILHLYLARKPVATLRVPLMGSGQDANSRAMWAYVNPTFVEDQRIKYNRLRVRRSRGLVKARGSWPGPLTPFYAAIFLAIAQHGKSVGQYYKGEGDDRVQQITLFVQGYPSLLQSPNQTPTYGHNKQQSSIYSLIEYTTTISDTYLRKLDEPHKLFNAELQIQERIIPINSTRPIEIYMAMKNACAIGEEGEHNRSKNGLKEEPLKKRELVDVDCSDGNESDERKRRKVAG